MKRFVQIFVLLFSVSVFSMNVYAQNSIETTQENLDTGLYEELLTRLYGVEEGYAYCDTAVSITSSNSIEEDVTISIPDAVGTNVWRVNTVLSEADTNCVAVEYNNTYYYLSSVVDAVFDEEGVTFRTNKLGIFIIGGYYDNETLESFSSGISTFTTSSTSIDESTLTQAGTWLEAPYAILDTDGDGIKETCYVYGTMTDTTELTYSNYETLGFYKVLSDNPTVTHAIINCSFGNRTNTDMMFSYCGQETDILILNFGSNFSLGSVTDTGGMFTCCYPDTLKIDLGPNFNTRNVTDMSGMFNYCGVDSTNFTLNLGTNFDTSNVTDMRYMFYQCGCTDTSFTLDLGDKFDTSNVTNMYMLFDCLGKNSEVFKLNLGSKFNTSKVTNMDYMFAFCGYASDNFTLDLGTQFYTSNVTSMNNMFYQCGYSSYGFTLKLGEHFDTHKVNSMHEMFQRDVT